MPTDEDRRKAASRLRECRGGWSSGECYYAIIAALGLPDTSREDGGRALYARLADLIEPNPDNIGTVSGNIGTASGIDRDALIELADEIRALNENADIHLFGTVRIGDTTLLAIERRIREAVGA